VKEKAAAERVRVGFIGFGEVASVLSVPLREKGAEVLVYDTLLADEEGRRLLEGRVRVAGIGFRGLADLLRDADYVLSTVTTAAAVDAARACAPHLRPGQVYLDLNSTAPSVKAELAQIVGSSGADFVEGAILGAVGATGAATEILTGGAGGAAVAERLRELGLRVTHYDSQIGRASTFKMLRSIFSKGVEALLLELLIAGRRSGIEGELWRDIVELLERNPFEGVASNWVRSHAVACERREQELIQVVETMREIGVEPLMTEATRALFRRSCELGLNRAFREKPHSMEAVVDFLVERLRGRK
jgi:3-hydroxyisobutyrate dehydrogenase-like beta-hydroxyacid dehydrogenase